MLPHLHLPEPAENARMAVACYPLATPMPRLKFFGNPRQPSPFSGRLVHKAAASRRALFSLAVGVRGCWSDTTQGHRVCLQFSRAEACRISGCCRPNFCRHLFQGRGLHIARGSELGFSMRVSTQTALSAVATRVPVAELRLVEAGRAEIFPAVRKVADEPVVAPPLPPPLANGGLLQDGSRTELLRRVCKGAINPAAPTMPLEVAHLRAMQLHVEGPTPGPARRGHLLWIHGSQEYFEQLRAHCNVKLVVSWSASWHAVAKSCARSRARGALGHFFPL